MHGATDISVFGEVRGAPSWRILLADSDPIFIRGLAVAIGTGFPIQGEATTAGEILKLAPGSDVLLTGFSLACGRNVAGLLPDLRTHFPGLAVVILISPTAAWMVHRLRAAGVRGVLSRRTAPADLPNLVADALEGRPLPHVTPLSAREASTAASVNPSVLTARELEIFRLIGLGKSGKEIAVLLGISDKTVSAHRENIKDKLDLRGPGTLNLIASSHATWEATGVDYTI